MDPTIAVTAVALILAIAIVVIAARFGINIRRRRPSESHLRRAQGDYQPPEPPEGRYWVKQPSLPGISLG
jgi:hypothetical protein